MAGEEVTQQTLLDARERDIAAANKPHLRWLNKAEHWGEWIRFSDTEAAPPESIWMMRGANGSVRFYAKGKGQVGPQHNSVVAASAWAWANRWLWLNEDATLDMLSQLKCREYVLAGGADEAQHVLDAPGRQPKTTPPEQHPTGSVA